MQALGGTKQFGASKTPPSPDLLPQALGRKPADLMAKVARLERRAMYTGIAASTRGVNKLVSRHRPWGQAQQGEARSVGAIVRDGGKA